MDVDIWVVGSSNQLFIRGSYTETKLVIKLAKSSLYTYIYIYTTFIYIYINVFYATNITRVNLTQSLI